MADRSVRVILSVVSSGFSAGMAKASADTKALTSTLETHKAQVDKLSTGSLLAGAAIAAGIGVAVKAYAEFDQAMSRVSATGADAKANLVELRAAALQAGADTKFSATEAAAGIESLLKAGVSAQDVLGGGLAGALSLASAGEMDVADAADVAATALTQFKLSGSDVGHVADLLAAGAGNAQGEVSDMAAALKQGGLIASQFGLSIDQTVGGLTAFASAGMIGSDAGTSMKTMLLALANPSKESAKLMSDLGINAYDAGGKFVGLEGLAGQLQSRLGTLSAAQRQQALAQIFGTDAMRAASVLYDQGATGIAGWTAKVNDAGYAARAAAEKMNNLAGDLEQFKGSVETSLIKAGESANGPLRTLTQNATGLVNQLGKIPAPIQAVTLGLGGIAGGGLIAVGGITKVVSAGLEMKQTMTDLAALHPKVASGLTSVGKAAGIAATAMVALQVASAIVGEDWQQKQTKADDLAHSMLDASVDVKALNDSFQFSDGGLTGATYDGVGASIKRALDPGPLRSFDDALDGLLGRTSTTGQITAQFRELDVAVSSLASGGKIDEAARQFQMVASEAEKQGVGIDKLVTLFPSYKAQLEQTAKSLGVVSLSTKDYVDWMGGKVPAAISAEMTAHGDLAGALAGTAGATDGLSDAQKLLVGETQKSESATSRNADALKKAADATWASIDATLAASGNEIAFQAAIDSASETIKGNAAEVKKSGGAWDARTQSLKVGTDAERENKTALDHIVSTLESELQTMAKNGAGQDEMTAKVNEGKAAWIANAIAAGVPKTAVEALWGVYKLNPGSVTTLIAQHGAEAAAAAAQTLRARVGEIPLEHQTEFLTAVNMGDITKANAIIDNAARARTAYIYTSVAPYSSNQSTNNAARIAAGAATGGYISGPGSATSDSIPAWLSNGEYVINAGSVAKLGLDRLHYLNAFGRLPAFASGGQVDSRVHYSQAAPRFAGGGAVSSGSLDGWSSEVIADAVASGLASSTLHLEMDGRPIDARIRAVTTESARRSRR
jgi:TP901 family phage tail tape measure protein